MLVIGEKEIESNSVGVRSRKDGDLGAMLVDEFISKARREIDEYAL